MFVLYSLSVRHIQYFKLKQRHLNMLVARVSLAHFSLLCVQSVGMLGCVSD